MIEDKLKIKIELHYYLGHVLNVDNSQQDFSYSFGVFKIQTVIWCLQSTVWNINLSRYPLSQDGVRQQLWQIWDATTNGCFVLIFAAWITRLYKHSGDVTTVGSSSWKNDKPFKIIKIVKYRMTIIIFLYSAPLPVVMDYLLITWSYQQI